MVLLPCWWPGCSTSKSFMDMLLFNTPGASWKHLKTNKKRGLWDAFHDMNLPIFIFLPVPASPLGRISLGHPTCQEPSLLAWLEAPGMWCYTCDAQQVRYRFAAKKGKVEATPKWEMLRSMHIENLVILICQSTFKNQRHLWKHENYINVSKQNVFFVFRLINYRMVPPVISWFINRINYIVISTIKHRIQPLKYLNWNLSEGGPILSIYMYIYIYILYMIYTCCASMCFLTLVQVLHRRATGHEEAVVWHWNLWRKGRRW